MTDKVLIRSSELKQAPWSRLVVGLDLTCGSCGEIFYFEAVSQEFAVLDSSSCPLCDRDLDNAAVAADDMVRMLPETAPDDDEFIFYGPGPLKASASGLEK